MPLKRGESSHLWHRRPYGESDARDTINLLRKLDIELTCIGIEGGGAEMTNTLPVATTM